MSFCIAFVIVQHMIQDFGNTEKFTCEIPPYGVYLPGWHEVAAVTLTKKCLSDLRFGQSN